LTRADVAARIVAAEAGVDYRRLRAGKLPAGEHTAARDASARLAQAVLHIDDGADLTAEAIAQTAPDVEGLALVVVDRLRHAHDPVVPLSGPALPAAARMLTHLARHHHVPVLAVMDTDDPDAVAALDADVTLTLSRDGDHAQVVVAERDFGRVATAHLRPEFAYARFTDIPRGGAAAGPEPPNAGASAASPAAGGDTDRPPAPATDSPATEGSADASTDVPVPELKAAEAELVDAALPYISGAATGISARVTAILTALRNARSTANTATLPSARAQAAELAAQGLRLPETDAGRRLAAALQAFATAHPASGTGAAGTATAAQAPAGGTTASSPPAQRRGSSVKPGLATFVSDRVARALAAHAGDVDAALQALARDGGSAIPDVMELFEATRVESNYEHTTYPKLPDPLIRKRRGNADDVWEARPKFTNPNVPKDMPVIELDVNAAYLAALQSAHLPIRTITHNPDGFDDLANYGRAIDYAGICRIDPVDWDHPELPHPLGDDRETSGSLWVPTSVLLSLKDFASPSYDQLCAPPVIREAYVAKGTTALFKSLVRVLNEARMRAITEGDDVTKAYVAAMYAKLVSTMGDSRKNHELRRPEWQHIIRGQAFSNLRRKAIRAHQAGLTVVHVGGTDELHLAGDVWAARSRNGKPLFVEGRALNQIKEKRKGK
jgi:hypothetical protein